MSALHQQQGGMSLRAFAEQSGLYKRHIQNSEQFRRPEILFIRPETRANTGLAA